MSSQKVARRAEAGDAITLLASAARSTTGDGADVTDDRLERATRLLFVLDISAQSGTTPTLDVAIQAKIGSLYTNLCRFAQKGAVTTKWALWANRQPTFGNELELEADPAGGSGALNNDGMDWLNTLRVAYTIGGSTPSYTFSVVVYPLFG